MRVYLDNAATTPIDLEVLEVMIPFMREYMGNPSSIHAHGREVRAAIEKARKTIASLLNTSTSEIFFTSGGTEADNFAIRCTVDSYGIKHAITSPTEHHAVLHTLKSLEKAGKITTSFVQLDAKGNVDLNHLEDLLKQQPASLVSLMHANNEVGTLAPIEKIGEICRNYQAFFHSDTVQTMGHYKHDLQQLPVDFIVGAAHKFHGPKGVGFIYINGQKKLHPFISGGAQERNMRGGTENVYGIIGLAKALEIAYRDMAAHTKYIKGLKSYMIEKLKQNVENISFNGMSEDVDNSLYTVLSVSFPNFDGNDMLLFNLDINNISASGGSACSSGSEIGSHVLTALHVPTDRTSVRFSFSKFNTHEEIDYVVEKLDEIIYKNA